MSELVEVIILDKLPDGSRRDGDIRKVTPEIAAALVAKGKAREAGEKPPPKSKAKAKAKAEEKVEE